MELPGSHARLRKVIYQSQLRYDLNDLNIKGFHFANAEKDTYRDMDARLGSRVNIHPVCSVAPVIDCAICGEVILE
ncbi:hypothetical protein PENSUB_347 [Penicillium subrubescens]|uniref:Uncharacterized protein n=1 Tax=Penicillium subrubescens TaxID=1316194 RepID=A0A1Q5UN88_9EURO|nr:hypothetical protein PENSUB_347 [Penicillium subrubescens]